MHAQSRGMQQRHKRVGDLEERAPALIDLPFVIPSIPIVDPLLKPLAPILTPLIDGKHPSTTTPTPPQTTARTTPTQAPAPSPTTPAQSNPAPSSGSGSPPASGSAPAGGSSGGNGGNGGNGGSTGGGGSGGSSDPSGNDTPNSPAAGTNPTGSPSGPASAPLSAGSSASGNFAPSSPSGATGSDGQPDSNSGANNGSDGSGSGTSALGLVVNANGANFVSGTTSSPAPGGETGAPRGGSTTPESGKPVTTGRITGSPTGTDGWPAASSTSSADPSRHPASSDTSVHHGLSTGIIVAIALIASLLFLVLLVFCCRRRAVATRLRRRRTWFVAGAYGSSDEYRDGAGAGNRSARSSFATHFDRGQMVSPAPQIDFPTPAASEEMSQVWPSNLSGSITVPPVSHTVESMPSPTVRAAPDRTSIGSLSSAGGSRPPSQTAQYPTVPDAAAARAGSPYGLDFPSPFSVRPFSPSETFSFPVPPRDDARSRASGVGNGSIVSGSVNSAAFFTAEDHPAASPEHPSPFAAPAENPFLDFTEIEQARPPSPSAASATSSTHFAPTETVRRPFVPTMDDEMAVAPGQEVRIVKRFDDGWAFAELLVSDRAGTQGLIPIDTLRPVEEDLPAFLAKKRLSSYGAVRVSQRVSALSGTSVGKAM